MNVYEKRAVLSLSLVSSIRMLGLFMLLPVLPVYAGQLKGATPAMVGIALGIYGFPQALLQIPAGHLSDRLGRKPVIIGGLIIFAIGSLIAALSHSITGIIVGRFLQGSGAIASATIALLSDLTTERYRTRAMAIFGMTIGLSFCLAMVLGPFVAFHAGTVSIFWLTLIFCCIAIFIMYFIVPIPVMQVRDRHNVSQAGSFRKVLTQKQTLPLMIGVFILHFTLMGLFMSLPVLLDTQGALPPRYHGWLYLGVLIASFFIMLPFIIRSEKKQCLKQYMMSAIFILFLAASWLAFTPHTLTWLILGTLFYFIAFNFLEACLPSLLSKIAPSAMKGTTMGVYSSCQFLGAGAGGIISGLIIQTAGYEAMLILCCLLTALWWIITFRVRQPVKMASITLAICPLSEADCLPRKRQMLMIPGVKDVALFAHEKTAYLKVDPDQLDETRLQSFGSIINESSRTVQSRENSGMP